MTNNITYNIKYGKEDPREAGGVYWSGLWKKAYMVLSRADNSYIVLWEDYVFGIKVTCHSTGWDSGRDAIFTQVSSVPSHPGPQRITDSFFVSKVRRRYPARPRYDLMCINSFNDESVHIARFCRKGDAETAAKLFEIHVNIRPVY